MFHGLVNGCGKSVCKKGIFLQLLAFSFFSFLPPSKNTLTLKMIVLNSNSETFCAKQYGKTKRTLYPAQIPQTKHDPHPAYHRICVIRVVPLRLGDAQRIHSTDKKSPSPQCPIDLDWSDELRPMTPEHCYIHKLCR